MNRYFLIFIFHIYSIAPAIGQVNEMEKDLNFPPAEIQTLLLFYNGTKIKGADVDVFAPLSLKVKKGFKQARSVKDSIRAIPLKLTLNEIGICAWDDDYLYIKTSAGWKRIALSTF